MPTTLNGILEAVETQLVSKVTKLTALNVEIAADPKDYSTRVSKYGAVIFGAGFGVDGFAGGLEFKEVRINIAFLHVRSTDVRTQDAKRIEMLFTELTDQARVGLQARFLTGSGLLSEPLELLNQGPMTAPKPDHVRVDQLWRCMYHHLISEHLSA